MCCPGSCTSGEQRWRHAPAKGSRGRGRRGCRTHRNNQDAFPYPQPLLVHANSRQRPPSTAARPSSRARCGLDRGIAASRHRGIAASLPPLQLGTAARRAAQRQLGRQHAAGAGRRRRAKAPAVLIGRQRGAAPRHARARCSSSARALPAAAASAAAGRPSGLLPGLCARAARQQRRRSQAASAAAARSSRGMQPCPLGGNCSSSRLQSPPSSCSAPRARARRTRSGHGRCPRVRPPPPPRAPGTG
jgi:hypothetical protein